ncbi:MAG: hypothetical protein AB1782_14405 [Cyanobacteriota bacterium]
MMIDATYSGGGRTLKNPPSEMTRMDLAIICSSNQGHYDRKEGKCNKTSKDYTNPRK